MVTAYGYVDISFSAIFFLARKHSCALGHPDSYGSKETIFILPFIATVIYAGMTRLNRFPHIFNYMVQITPQNAGRHYRRATKMIRYLKLGAVVLFCFITFRTIRISAGRDESLGRWLLPVTFAAALIFFLISIVGAIRKTPSDRE